MGITMRQQLDAIADAYEQKELRIRDLEMALITEVRVALGCADTCAVFKMHPAPWHSEKCDCTIEARNRCRWAKIAREKKEKS